MSQTLSGLFLVGAVNRLRERGREQKSGKSPEKSGKSQTRDKKGGTSPDWETPPPRLKHPRLAALDSGFSELWCHQGFRWLSWDLLVARAEMWVGFAYQLIKNKTSSTVRRLPLIEARFLWRTIY